MTANAAEPPHCSRCGLYTDMGPHHCPLDVRCPHCGAMVGDHCTYPDGRSLLVGAHARRSRFYANAR